MDVTAEYMEHPKIPTIPLTSLYGPDTERRECLSLVRPHCVKNLAVFDEEDDCRTADNFIGYGTTTLTLGGLCIQQGPDVEGA
jgi:hypothetical protein